MSCGNMQIPIIKKRLPSRTTSFIIVLIKLINKMHPEQERLSEDQPDPVVMASNHSSQG